MTGGWTCSRGPCWNTIGGNADKMDGGAIAMHPSGEPLDVSFFADAFRDSPIASVILEAGGNVLSWNTAAERLFGWCEAEVIGRPLPFIPAERMEEHRLMRKRDLEGENFTGRQITRVRKDGQAIDLS